MPSWAAGLLGAWEAMTQVQNQRLDLLTQTAAAVETSMHNYLISAGWNLEQKLRAATQVQTEEINMVRSEASMDRIALQQVVNTLAPGQTCRLAPYLPAPPQGQQRPPG